jgi:capsular exopolysaccharide synthesis family protein
VYSLDVPSGYPRAPLTPSGVTPEADQLMPVKRIIRAVRRRLSLLIAVFLLTFAAVAVYTFQLTPKYTASSSVIVNTRTQRLIDIGSVLSGLPADTAYVDTEAEILKSRILIAKVVTRLDLINDPEFNGAIREPSGMSRNIAAIKTFIKSLAPGGGGQAAAPAPTAASAEAERRAQFEGVVDAVRGAISINRVGPTYVIDISATSANPETAAKLANTVAQVYLNNQLDTKLEATRRANSWLNEQITNLRQEVRDAESRVEQHRASAGLYSSGTGGTLNEQAVSALNAQVAALEGELEAKQATLRSVQEQIRSGVGADSVASVLSSTTITNLRTQQAELNRRKGELERRYGVNHPDYIRLLSEEGGLNRQIEAEVRRIVASLEADVTATRGRLSGLQRSLNAGRSELAANSRANIQLNELQRDADASRTLLTQFLDRYKETTEISGITEPDAVINAEATVPGFPSFPKTSLNLALGFVLGLALAALVALITELMDNYFSTPEEVEQVAGVPYIGQIPLLPPTGNFTKAKIKPPEYLIEKPHSGFAEAFRNLRASIMFADIDKAAKTVAVVSSLPEEGKTAMTYCLGRMAAMSGTKTIVIDGDVRRRQLTEIAGLKPEVGLLEYLFGETRLADAVQVDEKTGLHILPLTDRKHTPRDVFGSRAFDALLNMLQQSYDLIIIDTGPVLLMAETRVVTSKVDQVVVAARWRRTNRGTLRETMKILRDFNANVAGVVLTFVDLRKRAHAYSATNYKAYSKYYRLD